MVNPHQQAKQKDLFLYIWAHACMSTLRTHYIACTTKGFREHCGGSYEELIHNLTQDSKLVDWMYAHCYNDIADAVRLTMGEYYRGNRDR